MSQKNKVTLYYIYLNGQAVSYNGHYTFTSTRLARAAATRKVQPLYHNHPDKHLCKDHIEFRKYLESSGELQILTLEL